MLWSRFEAFTLSFSFRSLSCSILICISLSDETLGPPDASPNHVFLSSLQIPNLLLPFSLFHHKVLAERAGSAQSLEFTCMQAPQQEAKTLCTESAPLSLLGPGRLF